MSDGLNIGKTWTVNVPAGSTRTVSPNLWQYSLFPYSTSPSIMYPSDGLSVLNDTQLFNFDYGVTSFMDTSANMFYQLMPMMKQWMAQQAEMYQKIMSSLHSNTNISKTNPENDDETKIDGTKVIDKEKVETVLDKIANNPKHKDNFNKEITFTNKDGKEEKTTLLRRLIDLSKQYIDDKSTAEISEENFEILWDIAGKYAKTGKLSSSDYDKLVEIAKNPGGPGAYVKPDDGKTKPEPKSSLRSDANVIERAKAENGYISIAEEYYFKAMDGPGTDKELLGRASEEVNKDNIIETIQAFNEHNDYYGDTLTLAEKIFDECSSWGTGNNHGWLTTNGWGRDDAKPFIKKISESLIDRATEFVEDKECSEETADAIKNAIAGLKTSFNAVQKGVLNQADKKNVAQAVDKLYETLLAAEKVTYKEFDKEIKLQDSDVLKGQ